MHDDTIAFALFLGLPIVLVSGVATTGIRALLGSAAAWLIGVAAVIGWPAYYIAMTHRNPGFLDGLPLLLFTILPMALGWLVGMMIGSRGLSR